MSGSYTQTPNLGLYKPTPNSDTGTWGYHLNSNADLLDNLLGTGGGSTSPFLPIVGGTMTGPLVLAADPVAGPAGAMQAATRQYVDNNVGGGMSQPEGDARYLQLTGGIVSGSTTFSAGIVADSATMTRIGGTNPAFLRLQGAAGSVRQLQLTTGGSARWVVSATSAAESGNNTGSIFEIDGFSDSGAFTGILLQANRSSAASLGLGRPEITTLAPWTQTAQRAVFAGAASGNYQNFIGSTNAQPTATLPANPISVTNSSTTVSVNWPGCASTNGPLSRLQYECWVNLLGATAVGGITPTGWVKVLSTPNANTFTFAWTSNATSTAVGGGSAVTVQPSYATSVNTLSSTEKSGAYGFQNQSTELWNVDPFFLPAIAQPSPRYVQRWHWTCGPVSDNTKGYALAGIEWDLTHRGTDWGYQPDAGGALQGGGYQSTTGIWIGPTILPSWATGGGTAANWGNVIAVYSQQGTVGCYGAYNVQPGALVGAARDPTGHGGVGVDVFGSYVNLASLPFATTVGTSTITVTLGAGNLAVQNNGSSVWMPNVLTIAGVTFGGAVYTIANVDKVGGSFTITGTGTASSSTSGGGGPGTQWLAFTSLAPYAPYQMWGDFKHGLISTNVRIESGGIIETQPGNGMLWSDGTGTASINASAPSPGNINVTLKPAGTGSVVYSTLPVNAANDAAAATAGVGIGGTYRNGSVLQVRVA